jgi:hypothetical protein
MPRSSTRGNTSPRTTDRTGTSTPAAWPPTTTSWAEFAQEVVYDRSGPTLTQKGTLLYDGDPDLPVPLGSAGHADIDLEGCPPYDWSVKSVDVAFVPVHAPIQLARRS